MHKIENKTKIQTRLQFVIYTTASNTRSIQQNLEK